MLYTYSAWWAPSLLLFKWRSDVKRLIVAGCNSRKKDKFNDKRWRWFLEQSKNLHIEIEYSTGAPHVHLLTVMTTA